MRTAGKNGFTLVELMVVIAIIAVLAMLLVPGLSRAYIMTQRAKCATNVKNIVVGMKQYSNVAGAMPKVPVTSWNVAIGSSRASNPTTVSAARNHSATLWLLVRGDHVPPSGFTCPSTYDEQNSQQRVDEYWDFASSHRISYGMQSPYGYGGSLSLLPPKDGSKVVWVADGSPYVESDAGDDPGKIINNVDVIDWADSGLDGDTMMMRGNSPNHDGDGQNVAYSDGRAEWTTSANCGKDGDNIYTANDHMTDTSPGGKLEPGVKNNENDTLILP